MHGRGRLNGSWLTPDRCSPDHAATTMMCILRARITRCAVDVNMNPDVVNTFSGLPGGRKMLKIGRVTDTVPDCGVKAMAGASAQQAEQ